MNILIACEESQRICIEMRKRGHNAFSCDIQKCSGGYPQWHIISDALISILNMPKPDCIIQPYEFGDHYSKRTYLWLKGLPPLIPTEYYIGEVTPWVNASGGKQRKGKKGVANTKKERSKTFCGIAKAMASQWT